MLSISIPESGRKLSESTGSSPGLFPKGKVSCMGTRLSQRGVVYLMTDASGLLTVAGRTGRCFVPRGSVPRKMVKFNLGLSQILSKVFLSKNM